MQSQLWHFKCDYGEWEFISKLPCSLSGSECWIWFTSSWQASTCILYLDIYLMLVIFIIYVVTEAIWFAHYGACYHLFWSLKCTIVKSGLIVPLYGNCFSSLVPKVFKAHIHHLYSKNLLFIQFTFWYLNQWAKGLKPRCASLHNTITFWPKTQ